MSQTDRQLLMELRSLSTDELLRRLKTLSEEQRTSVEDAAWADYCSNKPGADVVFPKH